MADQRALVKSSVNALLDSVEIDPRILMAAKAIQLMQGTDRDGNPKISGEMALAAAVYQAGTGQLVGRDFYVNDKVGRMEGYRGAARDAADRGAGELEIRYRPLRAEENEEHEVKPGDLAYICEVYQLRAWRMAQKMGQPYTPIIGVGIVREREKYDTKGPWNDAARRYDTLPREKWRSLELEGGMTWAKKAKNRAYKDAMRHIPAAPVSPDEVLEEGALAGVPMPPEGARLTMDQAVEWVRQNMPQEEDVADGEIVPLVPSNAPTIDPAVDAIMNPVRVRPTSDPAIDALAAEAAAAFDAIPTAQEARPATHWIDTPEIKKRFWAHAGKLGISEAQARDALGVKHIHDYKGNAGQAMAALDAYINRQVDEMAEARKVHAYDQGA